MTIIRLNMTSNKTSFGFAEKRLRDRNRSEL